MSNEWKVATLEQCKRLVELGVKLKTEKYWYAPDSELCTIPQLEEDWLNWKILRGLFPAPDVAELGKMLPQSITAGINYTHGKGGFRIPDMYFVKFSHGSGSYYCNYSKIAGHKAICEVSGPTEAQARCAALIWLIENGHLKPDEINP